MAGVQPEEIRAIGQPLLTDRWELSFPAIPNSSGDTSPLSVRARTCAIPGVTVDKTEVWFKGERVYYATRVNNEGSMRVTFEEGYNIPIWRTFYTWASIGGLGAPAVYKNVAVVSLLDENQSPVYKFLIGGIFPQDVPEIPLDYSSADIVRLDITFSYDWFEILS